MPFSVTGKIVSNGVAVFYLYKTFDFAKKKKEINYKNMVCFHSKKIRKKLCKLTKWEHT